MHLSMSPTQRVELRMKVQVANGVSVTVFRCSENWLAMSTDHQRAVRYIKARCKAESFRSLMDYLFAAVFPDCYFLVMLYYANEGPPLRDILSQEQCAMIDDYLLIALKLAYKEHCEAREWSWGEIRKLANQIYYRESA